MWPVQLYQWLPVLFCLSADFIPNEPSDHHWDRRSAGKQATLKEGVPRLNIANWSDRWCFEKTQWHWETSLFTLLYTQQLACPRQHYASSIGAYPFCVSCMKTKKSVSIGGEKNKQVIYCSLPIAHTLIVSLEETKKGWPRKTNTPLIKCSQRKKTLPCAYILLQWTVLSLDMSPSLLTAACYLMFREPEVSAGVSSLTFPIMCMWLVCHAHCFTGLGTMDYL